MPRRYMRGREARLILEDGQEFSGYCFGAERSVSGEVVFNTGMVGYPEALTDPSYKGQILTLTYPLIGNYGVPAREQKNGVLEHFESDRIHATALIVSDYSQEYSHWNGRRSLAEWLQEECVPGIYGIDTRKLTKVLREKGAMLGKIVVDGGGDLEFFDPNAKNIVSDVSVREPVVYNGGGSKKVVLIDCGAKNNIIRSLILRGLTVIRVPHDYDFFHMDFEGILISNGPGDPKQCVKTIEHVRKALERGIPTFGICLGSQIMALAAGGNTYKLKYGHRAQNQPCTLNGGKRCFITSQNHGFAVDMKTLSSDWEEYFVNANDGTNEGIKHKTKPFFAVQFHPEGHCGPEDTGFLFDEFVRLL